PALHAAEDAAGDLVDLLVEVVADRDAQAEEQLGGVPSRLDGDARRKRLAARMPRVVDAEHDSRPGKVFRRGKRVPSEEGADALRKAEPGRTRLGDVGDRPPCPANAERHGASAPGPVDGDGEQRVRLY